PPTGGTAVSELRHVPRSAVIAGWDFSTTACKCLAFDLTGATAASFQAPTVLHEGADGSRELSLSLIEEQARAGVREIAAALQRAGRLGDWLAGGISATHNPPGRIDGARREVRRAICWNDKTLEGYQVRGEARLGGPEAVRKLIGGPWAARYSLSHLVK